MTSHPADDRLRFYLHWLRGYVEVTRGVFEDTALLTQGSKDYVSMLLMGLKQEEDAYTKTLGGKQASDDVNRDGFTPEIPPEIERDLQEQVDREGEVFHRQVSILPSERTLLDDTLRTLLTERLVVLNRSEGVIRIRLTSNDPDPGVVHLEYICWAGARGTSQIALAKIPESARGENIARCLAACLANMSDTPGGRRVH